MNRVKSALNGLFETRVVATPDYTTTIDRVPFNASEIHSAFKLAQAISLGSRCVRSRVGAALLDPSGTFLGLGHNYVPGSRHEPCVVRCPRGLLTAEECPPGSPYDAPGHECYAVHAEVSATLYAASVWGLDRVIGAFMFVTREPCGGCVKYLEERGIVAVWQN